MRSGVLGALNVPDLFICVRARARETPAQDTPCPRLMASTCIPPMSEKKKRA